MNIDGVKTGIVLDHIKAGKSMDIYKYLRLDKIDNTVAIIKNADSEKYGKKDIIKIDQLIELDLDILGYIDSNITVNIVKDEKLFFRLVKAAFAQRRKTAVNSISNTVGLKKQVVTDAFLAAGIEANARAEALTLEQFAALTNCLTEKGGE
jgi:hypothetical protein